MALGIPKDQIRYIVDRLDIDATDAAVRAEIRLRSTPHPGWTQMRVKQAEQYALKLHHGNQSLHDYVAKQLGIVRGGD
jgi:hypothetical protein